MNYYYDLPDEIIQHIKSMVFDCSSYDLNKPSIKDYIDMLSHFNKRLKNINSSQFLLQKRKKVAFEIVMKQVSKLDYDKIELWKNEFEYLFLPKQKQEKQKKVEKDLSGFKVGDIVIVQTDYKTDLEIYNDIQVKCRIKKINKCSVTLTKYVANIDDKSIRIALQQQSFGRVYFNWTDELLVDDNIVIKNTDRLITKDDVLFKSFVKQTNKLYDFGD